MFVRFALDALSHEAVEDYANEHGIPITPTDPRSGDDGEPFSGVELGTLDKALGLNGKGQPPTNYHVDYRYNSETGLNEGEIKGENGEILGKITQTPGSNKFTIENLNTPEGVESSTSTVEVDQETGESGDLEIETQYSDGSSTISTDEGTEYIGPDGKKVNTAGC